MEQVDTALLAYWLEGGSTTRASEATGTPASTIEGWVKRYPDRLHELRQRNQPAFDRTILAKIEGIQLQALETIAGLVEKTDQDLKANRVQKPDQAAQRLATVLGIVTDKALLLQGRPNQIVGTQDASERLNALKQRFPWLVVDSTADDVTDAKELPEAA